jgi:hypothetical protein
MDAKIKADWLVALRSDQYKQCQLKLNDGSNGYCCLGVLCKVMGATFEDYVNPLDTEYSDEPPYIEHNRPILNGINLAKDEDESLSHYTKDLVGLSLEDESRLISMNDDEGKNFREIADYVEANL